jgi:hypothetical protein
MSNMRIITEKWIKWVPTEGLANKYYIHEVRSNIDSGFSIKLIDDDNDQKSITLVFPESVWCYRSNDEGIMQDTIAILNALYPKDFYSHWTFFKVENSNYLKWIAEESGGLYERWGLQHFCIITDDEMLDIITTYEPNIIKHEK